MTSVLFVCLGNICRSPIAEGIFTHLVEQEGLSHKIMVDSAGNGAWHEGDPPDPRAITIMAKKGFDISHQRSRPVQAADFERFDLILGMDHGNLARLNQAFPTREKAQVDLFLNYALNRDKEIPDPYYGSGDGFDTTFHTIMKASQALLAKLEA